MRKPEKAQSCLIQDCYLHIFSIVYILLSFAIIFAVAETILFCSCVCMCKQINTAIHLVKLAAECLQDLPILLIYPILNACLAATFIVLWAYVAAYLASCGDLTANATYGYSEWAYDETTTYAFLYWLFGLLWVLEFALAVGFTCVAFCFCCWFFTPEVPSMATSLQTTAYSESSLLVASNIILTLALFTE